MAYLLLFSVLSCFLFLDGARLTCRSKILCSVVVVVVLGFFAGLRSPESGADYHNYVSIFEEAKDIAHSSNDKTFAEFAEIELGYLYLNVLIDSVGGDEKSVFLVVAIVSVFLTLFFYVRESPFFFLSVLLYLSHTFLYREMIQIRAGLACAILLYSVPYLNRRNPLKFYMLVITGSLFHYGALIYLFVYPLWKFRVGAKYYLAMVLFSLVFSIVVNVKDVLFVLSDIGFLPRVIYLYLIWEKYNYALGLLNPVTLKQIVFIIALLLFRKRLASKFEMFEPFLFLYVLSCCWLIMFNEFAILAGRVATFLSIVEVVLLPMLVFAFKQKLLVYVSLVAMAALMLILNVFVKEVLNDYSTILWSVI